jgi:carbamoyl-phosphate synthase large subunit
MRSTGEVMGLDHDYAVAFAKAQLGAGNELPRSGTVFVSVRDERQAARLSRRSASSPTLGFGSWPPPAPQRLSRRARASPSSDQQGAGRPSAYRGRDPQPPGPAGLNTTEGAKTISDSKSLRRAALMHKVPYFTTMAGSLSAAKAIAALKAGNLEVHPLQSYF